MQKLFQRMKYRKPALLSHDLDIIFYITFFTLQIEISKKHTDVSTV